MFSPVRGVISLAKDSDGNMWAGTLKQGVYLLSSSGDILHTYDASDGISGNCVYAIECAHNKSVWLATNRGLTQFTSDSGFVSYFKSDGLQSNQYFVQSSITTKDGNVFFGGIEGVDFF